MIRFVLALLCALIVPVSAANFTPTTYGAVGDCVTDDTTALFSMRTAILAAQGTGSEAMTVSLRGKCYKYANNRWLWGIRNLYLIGGGARLQNVASFATFGANAAYPLVLNRSAFETTNVTPVGSFTEITSSQTFLINTANSGASSVTLQNIGDAANFTLGEWVLVYSYDQQLSASFPPNARYFDYAQVSSISGAVINLSAALAHSHSANFPEVPSAILGRARILPLDTFSPIPWGTYAYIENVTILDNPNALRATDNGYSDPNFKFHNFFVMAGYTRVDLQNVTVSIVVPSTSSIVNMNNGHIFGGGADKVVNSVNYTDVIMDNEMSECTGADSIAMLRGTVGLDSGWMFSSLVTISNASPGVVSWPGILLVANNPISLSTTGTLPVNVATGLPLVPGQTYFVSATGLTTGAFSISTVAGGAAINISSAGSGTHTATYSGRNVTVTCSPRSLTFNNSTLGTPYNPESFPPTWNLNNGGFPIIGSATNTTFMGGGGASIPVGSSPTESLTVDGTAVTTSGAAITMANVTVGANESFLSCTAPGGQIGYVPMGGGAETIGTITTITGTYTGPNTATVTFTGIPTVSTGDAMKCHPTPVGGITLSGNTYLNYGGAPAPP